MNIKAATNALNKINMKYEIILVDDGSTNNCFKEAKILKNPVLKVVGYKTNQGKGNAIKYGFSFAKGDYVAFVDSGRDINPKQIKDFIKIMEAENADIVIGSKRHPNSIVHYPIFRRFMSRVYQIINKILFSLNVQDTQVGIKLFKRNVLEKIMPKIAVKRFAFDLELLVIAHIFEYKIVEAPIVMRYRFGSTVKPSSVLFMLRDTLAIFYRKEILRYYDD